MIGKFNQTDFGDGDYTLLGDIHKFQYLNKKKTMAYPGSLLQMNYGEDIFNHGYILWDLENKKSELIRIKNNYAYYTIEINNGKLKEEIIEELPKNLRLRIFYDDTEYIEREKIINTIKEKHNLIQIDEIKQIKNLTINFSENNKQLQEISNINNVNELIIKYIKDNDIKKIYTEEKIKEISEELNNITKKINYNFEKTKKKLKINKLSFNNMFIYGENNNINFQNLSKIVGLIAENKRGKTSLIDCILFSIWSESDRTISNLDILKYGTKRMTSDITLTINDTSYIISRKSTKSKERLYNEVNLYEIDKNTFEKINITENDKKKTEEKIINIFGNSEDFTLLTIITQDNPINFLTMKDIDKKALLNKIFNLEIIKDVNREINKEYASLNKLNKEFDNINKENNLETIINDIEKLNKEKQKLNDELNNYYNEKDILNKQITIFEYELDKLVIQVKNNNIDNIDNLIETNSILINNIETYNNKLNENNTKIIELNKVIDNIKNSILELNEIENKYKIWKSEKKNKLNILNKNFEELNNLKKPLIQLSKTENKKKIELENKINEIQATINNYDNYEEYENYEFIEKYENKLNEAEEKKIELEKINKQINNIKSSLNNFINHKYNINCNECMTNNITIQKLYFEEELNKLTTQYNKIDIEIKEINSFINKDKNINKYNNLKENKKIKELLIKLDEEYIKLNSELKILKKIEKEYNKNLEFNTNINLEIENNRTEYNNLENSKYDEYEKYLELKENLNLNNETLYKYNEKNKNIINKLENLNSEKNNNEEIITKYNSNKILYTNINEIKNKLLVLKEKENKISLEYNSALNNINKINKELINYETNIKVIQKNKEIMTKNNKKKEILSIIKTATDNGGMLDDILKYTIIPLIETVVNNILLDIDNYNIKIIYDNTIKIIKIDNVTKQESNGVMASGHEKSILNVIFRIALSKLNSIISTNFFIIDEAFKNSDYNKKQKLKTLFEYLRNNYDWILVVTHDDYIRDNFDKEINIEHHNGTSLINYNN